MPGGFGITLCNVIKSGNRVWTEREFEWDLLLGEG